MKNSAPPRGAGRSRCVSWYKSVVSEGQKLLAVDLGLYLFGGDDALYGAVGGEDHGGAECTEVFASGHALLSPYAGEVNELMVGVGDQGEGKFVFGRELAV